ncbi:MAG: AMP-binding protein [Clostridia bacterium]|nr:AMP-binding protein [Clostridia bacterium]
MKLAFSTKCWSTYNFYDLCYMAKETMFQGIEPHNVKNNLFTDKKGAFNDYTSTKTKRFLFENKLSLPCIDATADMSYLFLEKTESDIYRDTYSELEKCIYLAEILDIPYVRLQFFKEAENRENFLSDLAKILKPISDKSRKKGVELLIETKGIFKDTKLLRSLFEENPSLEIGALWNVKNTCLSMGKEPQHTIENLGAYIKHVHFADAKTEKGKLKSTLLGEGELPVNEIMSALSSINYNGFITFVCEKELLDEYKDIEIILTHFASFMQRFEDPSKNKENFYYNRTHTGKMLWKKDILISETLPSLLDKMTEAFPDQCAVKYTTLDYTRTYSEFRNDVDDFARALVSLGVKAGSHVAIWAPNIPEWYIAFWAVTKIGAVLVSMNTAYKTHEAEYLLKQSDTHTLILTEGSKLSDYSAIIEQLCPELARKKSGEPLYAKRLPLLRNIITVGFKKKGALTWEKALKLKDKTSLQQVYAMAEKVSKDDVCNMQYTSGTTGFPKGVMLTHHNIVNNGKCIGDRMDLSTADRTLIHVPMFHCFGMVLAMLASITHGATIYPLAYFSPKSSLSCINNEHITVCHGVPTMFIAMLNHEDFEKTDFSFMRTGIMAGSPCPMSVMQAVVDKMNMREITIVYGQTEASPGCTMSLVDDPLQVRVSTVGRPLPEIECKIINTETGEDCKLNETGEFVARGYNVMKGYYKMPKATSKAIDKDGWLHTGDLALKTEDGNFKITGRLKDMIIRGGENIYPKEIEEYIYTHPKVSDVQVVGIPDEKYGEEILASVILKENNSMTADEMKDYVRLNMARHKVPRYVEFVSKFPLNLAGKVLKEQLKKEAIERLKQNNDK